MRFSLSLQHSQPACPATASGGLSPRLSKMWFQRKINDFAVFRSRGGVVERPGSDQPGPGAFETRTQTRPKRFQSTSSKFDLSWKSQNPFFEAQSPPKTLSKTLPQRLPNTIWCSNARNVQKWYHYNTKTTFLLLQSLQKSFQNRCQNAFKISFMLDTLLEP